MEKIASDDPASGSALLRFITNLPAPYKLACFRELAKRYPNFRVVFESAEDPGRRWFMPDAPGFDYEVIPGGGRLWSRWLSFSFERDSFPVYGTFDTPQAVVSMILRGFAGLPYGIWTSSTAADWRPQSRFRRMLKERVFSAATAVFVPGRRARDQAVVMGAKRVLVTPNCVDVDDFERALKAVGAAEVKSFAPPLKLLYVGRLAPEKDVAVILEALGKIPAERRGVISLRIVGYGPEEAGLRRRAAELGLDAMVEFTGFQADEALAAHYAWSDILILPSRSEPWGLVVNEAMQAGVVPVISDTVGAQPDLVPNGETGFVFKAGDADSLAAFIETIAGDPAQLASLSEQSKRVVAGFTPETFVDGLLAGIAKPHLRDQGVVAGRTEQAR